MRLPVPAMRSVTSMLHPFERSDIALVSGMPGSRGLERYHKLSAIESDRRTEWQKEAGPLHATVYRPVGFNGVRS